MPLFLLDTDPNHSPNSDTDNTIDHFVVIVGTGVNGKYFLFFDNASGSSSQGAHPNNKLYYYDVVGTIVGSSQTSYAINNGFNPYILTQV